MSNQPDGVLFVTPRELEIQGQIEELTRELKSLRDRKYTDELVAESHERARIELAAEDFVRVVANSPEFRREISYKETWLDTFATKNHLTYAQYRELKDMITNSVWRGAVAVTIQAKLVQ